MTRILFHRPRRPSYSWRRWRASFSIFAGIARAIRDRLYDHLSHLPCSYHDRADTGHLVQRCTSDVETVRVFLAAQVVEIGRAVFLLATFIPVMLFIDVRMTLISLALFPLIVLSGVLFWLS